MTIEGKGAGNGLAAHAIEAREIDQAQLPPAGCSPLGENTLEPVFPDDDDAGHGQHLVVKVCQRRGSQTSLDQRTGLEPHVVIGPQNTLVLGVRSPRADGARMMGVVLVHQGKEARGIPENLFPSHRKDNRRGARTNP